MTPRALNYSSDEVRGPRTGIAVHNQFSSSIIPVITNAGVPIANYMVDFMQASQTLRHSRYVRSFGVDWRCLMIPLVGLQAAPVPGAKPFPAEMERP